MKAITIKQPWAELILQGRKTIELRTWGTTYRGRIAVHAGSGLKREACDAYGIDPAGLTRGALVGTVEIVDIIELDGESWDELRGEHLSLREEFPGDLLGWRLANPQRLPEPIPWKGRLGIFYVDDEAMGVEAGERRPEDRPFELRVVPRNDAEYGLALYQLPIGANGDTAAGELQQLVELWGTPLQAVSDHVLDALRRGGYRVTDLSRSRREPFYLDEETGVRLGLLFLAVKPISKLRRIEEISLSLRGFASEEAYYWFSKCAAGPDATRAQQALRILLSEE